MTATVRMKAPSPAPARGFSLIELMVTMVVLALVVISLAGVVLTTSRSKTSTMNNLEAAQSGRIALDMVSRDLRSAGYEADRVSSPAQNPIAYVDSMQIIINANLNPYPDTLTTPAVRKGVPLAYDPADNPKPFPLNGTSWQPPMRYLTGAECIRWTLDVNNDGAVNAADIADANGLDAQRTPNPNDYVLVRQVYGDSTAAAANNNGGGIERVGLVARPGGGTIQPLFRVYLSGSATPWNWSSGPVPANQLANITRVQVVVTSESPKPDWRRQYSRTEFKTDISSMRNVPEGGPPTFAVDGYVFDDKIVNNGVQDTGEPGIPNAVLRLGLYNASTDANGYFYFNVPAGNYTLKQTPPSGYGIRTSPDSFVIVLTANTSRSFADSARAGGQVRLMAYEDLDGDLVEDAGEPPVPLTKFTMTSTGEVAFSNSSGKSSLFAPVGSFSVNAVGPDSFVVMSANPVTGTMADGDSASFSFALQNGGFGDVEGAVYLDANRNGAKDGGEAGIANVWVGVTPDGGVTVKGYDYTDAAGAYTIKTPANDPPRTQPYSVLCVPPPGFYPTSTTNIPDLWVQDGGTYSNNDFGMSSFQVITLNATRVLSLASQNVLEKDWNGNQTQNARLDADIVLGADAAGTDQISTWFNQWNSTPLFNADPTYSRSAPQAVMSMAVDTLDGTSPKERPDLVTGTKAAASGNFFVWFSQNSNGNEGYFPTAHSAGQNYKTSDNGDVQAVLTADVGGGVSADAPDIIVGTKSPTAGRGSIEVWRSNNASTPAFARDEIYPVAGALAAGSLGEVTCMALNDIDGDGLKDLIVGTKTIGYSGQVVFLRRNSVKNVLPHFTHMSTVTLSTEAVTALAVADVNTDGRKDVVIGTQSTDFAGKLIYLRCQNAALFNFTQSQSVDAPGIVTSMLSADYGGTTQQDLAVGFRQSNTSYAGGVRLYFLDGSSLPTTGTDPSGGAIVNMVPALTSSNFNFGANPAAVAPFLMDLAAGVKSGPTTGALIVFIR